MIPVSTMSSHSLRKVLWIVFAVMVISVGISTVYRAAWDDIQRTDYTVYTAAGQAVLDHTDIYAAHNARGWNYVYPPPFALLLAPLAKLPGTVGSLLWYLLEVVSMIATSAMAVVMLERDIPDHHRNIVYAVPLLSLCTLLVSGTMRCQASAFMIVLMVASFHWHFRGKPTLAGLSLAAAAVLKVFPLALLLYFVVRRQWRTVLATVGGIVVLTLLLPSLFWGWQHNIDIFARWLELVGRTALMANTDIAHSSPLFSQLLDAAKPRNQSLESLFLSASMAPTVTKLSVAAIATLMLGAMTWASARVSDRSGELALASAFMIWSLLIPPVSETHYFGALVMPLTTVLGMILYGSLDERRQRLSISLLAASMISVMCLIGFNSTALIRPLCLASLALWGVLMALLMRNPALAVERP